MNNLVKTVAIWMVIALVLLTVFNQVGGQKSALKPIEYSVFLDEVRQGRYEIRYRRVTVDPSQPNRVAVDYTYTGSYTLRRPIVAGATPADDEQRLNIDPVRGSTPSSHDDEVWFRRVADNRLELERVGEEWRILSGM